MKNKSTCKYNAFFLYKKIKKIFFQKKIQKISKKIYFLGLRNLASDGKPPPPPGILASPEASSPGKRRNTP